MEIPRDVGHLGAQAPERAAAQAAAPVPVPGVEAGAGLPSLSGSLDAAASLPVNELPPALDALADALVRRLERLPRS